MIEAEVHNSLRAFLRSHPQPNWPHNLTMARLVARALRLGRSALIQTGLPSGGHRGPYRWSYLMPLLLWSGPVILVASPSVQQRLLKVEIPRLCQWLGTLKPIATGEFPDDRNFQGLLLISPEYWLNDRLKKTEKIPPGIPTIFDGVDDLQDWTSDRLRNSITPTDWHELMHHFPPLSDIIRDTRIQLTRSIFQHPANPYQCSLLDSSEQEILQRFYHTIETANLGLWPVAWRDFWQRFYSENQMLWAEIDREQGYFSLFSGCVEVASALSPLWYQQPVVLIGGAVDLTAEAPIFRQQLGLNDLTCVKFSPDRHSELIQLYLPDSLPMPNTPQFQAALFQKVRSVLCISPHNQGLTVLLVGDMPLKNQIGAFLASEFGSRVQVEKTCLDDNGILVTGWEFWRQHQEVLPTPILLIVATLPLPSLENPLVAGRVAYYKRLRQDWFRLYLLPAALTELQRAIAPIRQHQGVVALLDNRVNYRSYGNQVLAALSPLARINYLDTNLFNNYD